MKRKKDVYFESLTIPKDFSLDVFVYDRNAILKFEKRKREKK